MVVGGGRQGERKRGANSRRHGYSFSFVDQNAPVLAAACAVADNSDDDLIIIGDRIE